MTTSAKSRTVRIEDHIWKPFTEKAKSFGLSNTAYLKIILMKSNEETVKPSSIILGEPETVSMTSEHQNLAEKIMAQSENIQNK